MLYKTNLLQHKTRNIAKMKIYVYIIQDLDIKPLIFTSNKINILSKIIKTECNNIRKWRCLRATELALGAQS